MPKWLVALLIARTFSISGATNLKIVQMNKMLFDENGRDAS